MKTQITITDTKTDIASFAPVEGRYDVNATGRGERPGPKEA